jgi:hypothetical protein
MAIGNSYPKDIIVEDADLFLGTKASTNTTVNYTAQGIANYLNINGKVSITGQMSFKFTEYSNLNKTISFPGGGGNNTPFASISQLIVSTIDLSGQQVEIFLAYLIDKEILLARQNEINSFGNYKITAYAATTNPAFYTLDLEFIGGNGFILKDNYYDIVAFSNQTIIPATPSLDEVLTVGNTATNDINLIGNVTATSFIKSGGTNLQYLMADGSVTIGGGSQTLQQVTDAGNITTNTIILDNTEPYGDYLSTNTLGSLYSNYTLNSPTTGHSFNADYGSEGIYLTSIEDATVNNIDINDSEITVTYHDGVNIGAVTLDAGVADNLGGYIRLARLNAYGAIRISSLTNNIQLEFPNKVAGTYTIATTDDIPTIGTWGVLNYPIWSSGTPFVKMTAAGTFVLDTNTYLTTAVTSIGITVPPAFSVTPSSITTSGTFAITGAGTASQYIRGDGQLATFPTSGGGGSSVLYYLNGSVAASVATYKQMSNAAVIGTGTDFSLTGNGLIAQFLTDAGNPNRLEIPGGAWNFEMFFSMSSNGGTPEFYVELLKYDGAVFTSIANGSLAPEAINGGTLLDLYLSSLAVPTTTLLLTDRLAVRVYIVNNSGGRTATLHTENSHLCQIITTFSSGISAINGLTSNNQYLAVGTSGTDFNINSALEIHTFNLPSASATARGVVTTEAQTLAGAKTLSTAPILSSLTASQLLALDASKNVQSLDTATYPSLTELSYVKGVTGSIQNQINAKKDFITIFYSQTPILIASLNWFRPVRGQNNWFTHSYEQEPLTTFNPDLGLLDFSNRTNKYTVGKQSKLNNAIISVSLNTSLEKFRIICMSFKIASGFVTNQTILFDTVVNGDSFNTVTVIPTINSTYVLDAGSFITYFIYNYNTAITIRTLNVNLTLETL